MLFLFRKLLVLTIASISFSLVIGTDVNTKGINEGLLGLVSRGPEMARNYAGKAGKSLTGVTVSAVSLMASKIPCEPGAVLLDALVAIFFGLIVYTIILWILVEFDDPDPDEDINHSHGLLQKDTNQNAEEFDQEENGKDSKHAQLGPTDSTEKTGTNFNQVNDETDLPTKRISLDLASLKRTASQKLLLLARLTRTMLDPISWLPPKTTSVETQVREKKKLSVEIKKNNLKQCIMHIVEISPDDAAYDDDSESSLSVDARPPCACGGQGCGLGFCDIQVCGCPGDITDNAADREFDFHDDSDLEMIAGFHSDSSKEHHEESPVWWKDERRLFGEEDDNINNNNRLLLDDVSGSSTTLCGSGESIGESSTNDSDYLTAEEDFVDFYFCGKGDMMAEGDGAWRMKRGRPEAILQTTEGSHFYEDERCELLEARRRKMGKRNRRKRAPGYYDSVSTSSTVDPALASSRSECPSTTDGVALISPSPMTPLPSNGMRKIEMMLADESGSEVELTLAEQLTSSRRANVILEGGSGDCKLSELNNREWFLDNYQGYIFRKTARHVFGTADVETLFEES